MCWVCLITVVIGVLHDVCEYEIIHKPRNHRSILPCLHNSVHYHQWASAKEITLLAVLHKTVWNRLVFLWQPHVSLAYGSLSRVFNGVVRWGFEVECLAQWLCRNGGLQSVFHQILALISTNCYRKCKLMGGNTLGWNDLDLMWVITATDVLLWKTYSDSLNAWGGVLPELNLGCSM